MPTYLFRCHRCSHHFEVNLPFGNKAAPSCPRCSAAKTHKVITPPAVHFKGTGFFKTDSQKKSTQEKKPAAEAMKSENKSQETDSVAKETPIEAAKTEKKGEA